MHRIEQDMWAFQALFGRFPGSKLHDTPGLLWLLSPAASPLCNGVFRTNLEPCEADGAVDAVLSRHLVSRLPLSWWVGPSSRPMDLAQRLVARGFRLIAEEPGMAVDLTALRTDSAPVSGLDVVEVADDLTLREWANVLRAEDPAYADACVEVYGPLCLAVDPTLRLFVGRWNGQPAATSLLFTGAGVASVQHVTTLLSARRRGIGTAMVLAALRRAGAVGHLVGVLTATPMAVRVYEQLGFERLCTFSVYCQGEPATKSA